MAASDLTIREATHADVEAIVAVGTAALGWNPIDPNIDLFRWKHFDNPFGASPMWLAEVDGEIAGYRVFMRWELEGSGRDVVRAVRAVDTATHPDFQRRGVFSSLANHGVAAMVDDGVDIVFNTPNTQSRPGYLKLGWVDVGRLPLSIRPTSMRSIIKLGGARTSAGKWSIPSDVGESAADALADLALEPLVASQPKSEALSTRLDVEFLRWRYGLDLLAYRAWAPDGVGGGVVFHRLRHRGTARECAVGLVLAPDGDNRRTSELLASLTRSVDADYLAVLGRHGSLRSMFVPAPKQGPRLTARALASEPPTDVAGWDLGLGDIELF